MNKKIKNIFIIFIFLFGLNLTSNNILANDNVNIEIIPASPEPESEIEIKVFINIDGIEQVNIEIQECNITTGLCFPNSRKNITMSKIDDNNYIAIHKLIESKASYIEYNLLVKTEIGWEYLIEKEKTNLTEPKNNGDSNINGNGDTPGFEIITLFLSIIIVLLILNKRKR